MLRACASLSVNLQQRIVASSSTHLNNGVVNNGVVPSSNSAGIQLPAALHTRRFSNKAGGLEAGRRNKIGQGRKGTTAPSTIRCSAQKTASVKTASVKVKAPEIVGLDGKQTMIISGTLRFRWTAGGLNSTTYALHQLLGQEKLSLQLVSLDMIDPGTQEGIRSSVTSVDIWAPDSEPAAAYEEGTYRSVQFSVPNDFGTPGAVVLESTYSQEFFLDSLTLQMLDQKEIHFSCNSWIHQSSTIYHAGPRIFFANQVYLPNQTPPGLEKLRIDELVFLRGDGTGERKTGERIYDYDVYNDLGKPDEGEEYGRPVLGGSQDLPYPRRCRTGRKPTQADPASEASSGEENFYVPRDDMFSDEKRQEFNGTSLTIFIRDVFRALVVSAEHFGSFDEVHSLYDLESPPTKFPQPYVVQASKQAWMSDEEFARQRVSGINPLVIERLKVFPPQSSLDPETYGPPESSITAQKIEGNLEGLTVQEALDQHRLFLIDYHDSYLPYLEKINALPASKQYASRTLLFLTTEGVLKPVAIELSLPPKNKGEERVSEVYTPPPSGETDWIWQLAKAHATSNDAGYHQLISHWLRTHACMEPFVIATRRQLSALHPLYLLLSPHFKDTMNINSLARESLINADGIIEGTFAPGRYCMELSSVVYKSWRLDEQALPADLIKRGMAVKHESAEHGLRLVMEDYYPFGTDGLDLWATIEEWVSDFVSIYYNDDGAVQEDWELQRWWKEIREVGHGDHQDGGWWAAMQTVEELKEVLATVIWVSSGLHAAVNFGQYGYTGFMPNCPTTSSRLIPEKGSDEYEELVREPERYFLNTFSAQAQAGMVMATVELLSHHMGEEEYVGQRSDPKWTSDERVLAAFDRFYNGVTNVETRINARNEDRPPYTLLLPSSPPGVTQRGVPNSISI